MCFGVFAIFICNYDAFEGILKSKPTKFSLLQLKTPKNWIFGNKEHPNLTKFCLFFFCNKNPTKVRVFFTEKLKFDKYRAGKEVPCPKSKLDSVLCTDQSPFPAFSALNPGSALNPRTLNPGTTVLV